MKENLKRVLSMLLVVTMLLQYVPMTTFATAEDNLCDHHTVHDEDCHYAAAREEEPCTHECGEECAQACVHAEHDDLCGYAEAVEAHECHFVCVECAEGETEPSSESTEPSTEATEPSGEPVQQEPVPVEQITVVSEKVVPDVDLPDNDELFAMYAEQKFYGYEMATFGTAAKERLNEVEQSIYDALKAKIEAVATSGGSTVFVLSDITGLQTEWTNTELGVDSIEDTSAVKEKFTAQFSLDSIVAALLSDCPFDLYWYDKTSASSAKMGYSISRSYYNDGTKNVYVEAAISNLTFTFAVATGYAGGENAVTTDVAKISTVKTAAQAVVENNKGKTAYEKLVAYKEYICNQVSYNQSAVDNNAAYGDPWQLIYVFDNDASTNVVCEGYAKAFQYLCDLGGLDCISVTGNMSGGTGAGGHMWNIVTLDGKNYLVDVTNSDAGSVGQDGGLFLVGNAEGTASGYSFTIGSQTITFTYDSETSAMWGGSALTLAAADYTVPGADGWYKVNGNTLTIDGTLGGKATATEEDVNSLVEAIKGYVDRGITTLIVTGSNPALYNFYDVDTPAVSAAIFLLTDSDGGSSYYGTIDLILPNVTEIVQDEFAEAYALNSITLPKVTKLGERAFSVAEYLQTITFGSVLTEVDESTGPVFSRGGEKVGGCDLILNCGQMNESSVSTPDLTNNIWRFKYNNEFKSITLTHTEATAATCTDQAVCDLCGESYGEVDLGKHYDGCSHYYSITFYSNQELFEDLTIEVLAGDTVTAEMAPETEYAHYEFIEWYDSDTLETITFPMVMPEQDLEIWALHEKKVYKAELILTPNEKVKFNYYYADPLDVIWDELETFYGDHSWEGHSLTGWEVKNGNNGYIYQLEMEIVRTDSLIITALWKCESLTHVEAKAGTCSAEGNIEYYECTCGKLYADAEATTLLTGEVTTPKDSTNHTWNDGTCTGCGNSCTHESFVDGKCPCGLTGGYCGAETNEGGEQSIVWTYDEATGAFAITGTGAMKEYLNYAYRPWDAISMTVTSLTISEGVTRITKSAFHHFLKITNVTIPASVEFLGVCAFANCSALETVTFAEGSSLTMIEKLAFQWSSLTQITLPAAVKQIGHNAFYSCDALTGIYVEEGNTAFKAIDGVLYTFDGATLLIYPCGKGGVEFTTPEGVTTIAENAFEENLYLETVTLSEGVTTIEGFAFFRMSSLSTINIPASVTVIGETAFVFCIELTTVNVPCNWDGSLYTFEEGVTVNIAEHTKAPACTPTDDGRQHVAFYSCCGATVTENHTTTSEATCQNKAVCGLCGEYGEILSHEMDSATGNCANGCGQFMAQAMVGETYCLTLADAAAAVAGDGTITLLQNVTIAEEETVDFPGFVTLAGDFTVTNQGTVTIGGEAAVIHENKLYLEGDLDMYMHLSGACKPTYWAAGDGYVLYDGNGTMRMYDAEIEVNHISSEYNGAIYTTIDLVIEFYGENHLILSEIDFTAAGILASEYGDYSLTLKGGEDAQLNISAKIDANAYGLECKNLNIISGTVNVTANGKIGACAVMSGDITIGENAVLNASASDTEEKSFGVWATESITVNGTLSATCGFAEASVENAGVFCEGELTVGANGRINGLLLKADLTNMAIVYTAYGNTDISSKLIAVVVSTGTVETTFTVLEDATLTVKEGVTLDLSAMKAENIDFSGTVVNKGTILLPEGFGIADAPESGEIGIGDKTYTWDDANNKWICGENSHIGGTATCKEQAKCEACGASYGEILSHEMDSATGNCANGCGQFMAQAMVGETYCLTLADAAAAVAADGTITLLADVTIAESESVDFPGFVTLAGDFTVTNNGTVIVDGEAAVIHENKLYLEGGELYNGNKDINIDWYTMPTYWTAGGGNARYDGNGTLKLDNAQIYNIHENESKGYAILSREIDLVIEYQGTNTVRVDSNGSAYAIRSVTSTYRPGFSLTIKGVAGATLDVKAYGTPSSQGIACGELIVESGEVTATTGGEVQDSYAVYCTGDLKICKDAVLTASANKASTESIGVYVDGSIVADGILNATCGEVTEWDEFASGILVFAEDRISGTGSIHGLVMMLTEQRSYVAYGDAVLADRLKACVSEDKTTIFTVPEGTSLTVQEGVTLDLSAMKAENIDFSGTVVNKGTILLPEGFGIADAPESGEIGIGDKTYTWDDAKNNWICGENSHIGGTATCQNKAICEACGDSYGEPAGHAFDSTGKCSDCGLSAKAKIDGVYYTTLAEALAAGGEVDALTDFSGDFEIPDGTYFYGGEYTFSGKVTNKGTIYSGTFSGEVINESGYINTATFTETSTVINDASIVSGTFSGKVTNNMEICSGTFTQTSTVYNETQIIGGTYFGTIINNGITQGGEYYGEVTNNGVMINGVYSGTVSNNNHIAGGTFNCTLINNESGSIDRHDSISIGDNYQYVDNGGTIGGDHIFGGEATCQGQKCKVCNFIGGEVNPNAHTGGTATCTEKAVCDLCGVSYGELAEHTTISEATCMNKAICSVCGEYGELEEHDTSYIANDDADTITYRCANCDTQTVTVSLEIPTGNVYGTEFSNPYATGIPADYEGEYPSIRVGGSGMGNPSHWANAGEYEVTMTWGDETVTGNTKFVVSKADPAYTVPANLTAIYGDTLENVNLPEGFAWTDATLFVGNAGTNTFTATFTPNDTDNYNVITDIEVPVQVAPKAVTSAEIAISGSYTYTGAEIKPAVTVVDYAANTDYDVAYSNNIAAGTATVTVSFKGNYSGTVTKTFQIGKAMLIVTAENKSMTTGRDLPELTYTITGFVGGETEDVLTAKPTVSCEADGQTEGTFDITVSGAEADNYDFTYKKGTLTVVDHVHNWSYTAQGGTITAFCGNAATCDKATQTITLVAPTGSMVYDGKVRSASIDGSIDGVTTPEITYTGDCKSAGTHTASISLDDAVAKVNFTIDKATVNVTADAKTRIYGEINPELTYKADTLVEGNSFSGNLATIANAVSPVGEYDITIGTLSAGENYNINFTGAKLTVVKAAAPDIQWPSAAALTYGQKLFESALTSSDANGTFAWKDGSIVPTVNNNGYSVVFTPEDEQNYDYTNVIREKTIAVTVGKATPDVTVPTGLTAIYGQTLADVALPNGWEWVNSNASVGDAGTHAFDAVFTPEDTSNYNNRTENLTVDVEQKAVTEPAATGTYTYTGSEQTVVLTGVDNSCMTIDSGDKGTNAGSYEVEIILDSNHKWADGSDGKVQWTIAKAKAAITVDTTSINVTYGETVSLPNATANFGTVTCNKTAADLVNAGTYTVTYSVAGTGNYDGDSVSITVTVNAKSITVAADAVSKTYGEADPVLTYTVVGMEGDDQLTGELKRVSGENVGNYAIEQNTLTAGSNYHLTYTGANLTINAKPITAADVALNGSLTYTGEEQTQAITVNEGITYEVSGNKATNVGNYELTVKGIDNYTGEVKLSWTIKETAAKLTKNPVAKTLTYNGKAQTLVEAGSTNDGKLLYSLSENGTYTENVPTGMDAGEYTIWYYVEGDSNHSDTVKASVKVAIAKAVLTVTAKDHSVIYGDLPANNGVSYSGFVNGETTDVLGGELTYSYNYEQYGDVGTYEIIPTGLTATNYEVSFVNGELTVNAKSITAADVALNGSLTYTGEEQTQAITVNEGITYEVSGNKATNVGNYELTVKGIDNYTGEVKLSWTIKETAAKLTKNPVAKTLTYNGKAQTLVEAGSTNDGKLLYSLSENGTYTENVPTGMDAGEYTIWYYVEGDSNHSDTVKASVKVAIAKAVLTVTAKDHSVIYGDLPANNGVSYSGFVNGETTDVLGGELTYSYNYEQYGDVGTYEIIPAGLTATNYEVSFVNGELTVNAKSITVAADAVSKTYGDADPTLTYKVEGMVNDDPINVVLKRAAGEKVGTYAIKADTIIAGDNYSVTYTGADFTIEKRNMTITAKDQTVIYGEPISDTEFATTGLVSGHSVTATLTAGTNKVTANSNITVSAAVITADGEDVTGNYEISYVGAKLVIKPDTSKIDSLSTENVTSANEADIQAVLEMMEDAESTMDEWAEITAKCQELLAKADEIAAAKKEVTEAAATFDLDTVKSTDQEALAELAEGLDALLNGQNLTDDERAALEVVLKQINSMIETIEKIAANSKEASDTIDTYDPASVKSDDKEAIESTIVSVEQLLEGNNLTDEERKALEEVKAEAEKLLQVIEAAQKATESENTEKVENVTAGNVKPEDKEDLENAKVDLQKALDEMGGNYTEDEKNEILNQIQRIDDALKALENVNAVKATVTNLPNTVEPDDEDTAALILKAKEAYEALTDHEKSLVDDAIKQKLDTLLAALTDYEVVKGDGGNWNSNSNDGLTFTVNAPFSKFVGIEVDGKEVDSTNYEVKAGSTIITLKQSYLKKLSTGEHKITILFVDGETSASFKIESKNDGGSNNHHWGNIWDWIFGCKKGHHKYVSVVTEPTCERKGYTTHTCKICHRSYKDSYTRPLGHNWDNGKVTKKATCTKNGVKTFTCKDCHKTRTETIKALGHDWDNGKVTKKATCTKNGEKTFTCENCHKTYTQVIKATGHLFKNGKCKNCGAKKVTKNFKFRWWK